MQPYLRTTVLGGTLWDLIVCGGHIGFSEVLLTQRNDNPLFRETTEIMTEAASHNCAVYTEPERQPSANNACRSYSVPRLLPGNPKDAPDRE